MARQRRLPHARCRKIVADHYGPDEHNTHRGDQPWRPATASALLSSPLLLLFRGKNGTPPPHCFQPHENNRVASTKGTNRPLSKGLARQPKSREVRRTVFVSRPQLPWTMMISRVRRHARRLMSQEQGIELRRQGRREFLKAGGAVTAALLAPTALRADTPKTMPALPSNPVTQASMPTRNLGKTGYKVGIFSLGGQAASRSPTISMLPFPSSSAPSTWASTTSIPRPSMAVRTAGASSTSARLWPTAATRPSSPPRPRSAPATAPCA